MCFSAMVRQDFELYEQSFGARIDGQAFADYTELSDRDPTTFNPLVAGSRIWPRMWAPLMIEENGERLVKPMRFGLLPHWRKKDFPAKTTTFNARIDNLEKLPSWKSIFMRRHGLLLVDQFFEYVPGIYPGEKMVIGLWPKDRDYMWIPCLWDRWTDGKTTIESFAMITRDPPADIAMVGHERCPTYPQRSYLDMILNPEKVSKDRIYEGLLTFEMDRFGLEEAEIQQ